MQFSRDSIFWETKIVFLDELISLVLEILGQAKNPSVIQTHLKKLFAGVNKVRFDAKVSNIIGMESLDGEIILLERPVKITEQVEVWLKLFADEMKSTLKSLLLQCLSLEDIFKFPSQILGLTENLHFTEKCEKAIKNSTLDGLSKELKDQLVKYTSYNFQKVSDISERKVTILKVKALILDVIHFLDVVRQLQDAKVSDTRDWTWQRQLRFYISNGTEFFANISGNCVCRMHNAEFSYTFEYQGNPAKLVHTPLTDKCYLTLTQAMSSGFGGLFSLPFI